MHHQRILDLYRSPKFFKTIESWTYSCHAANQYCGDEISFTISVKEGVVDCICYQGTACSICLAAAELLCQNIKGASISELKNLKETLILNEFDISKDDKRAPCALLAYNALQKLEF